MMRLGIWNVPECRLYPTVTQILLRCQKYAPHRLILEGPEFLSYHPVLFSKQENDDSFIQPLRTECHEFLTGKKSRNDQDLSMHVRISPLNRCSFR